MHLLHKYMTASCTYHPELKRKKETGGTNVGGGRQAGRRE
jgi:hypothetical protein